MLNGERLRVYFQESLLLETNPERMPGIGKQAMGTVFGQIVADEPGRIGQADNALLAGVDVGERIPPAHFEPYPTVGRGQDVVVVISLFHLRIVEDPELSAIETDNAIIRSDPQLTRRILRDTAGFQVQTRYFTELTP